MCAGVESDLLLPTLPPFSPSLQPSPRWPQSHNPPVRLATDPHIQPDRKPQSCTACRPRWSPALLSLALPLVASPAAGTCWTPAPPVWLPPGPHTHLHTREQASLRRGSTAIHAACSRIAAVALFLLSDLLQQQSSDGDTCHRAPFTPYTPPLRRIFSVPPRARGTRHSLSASAQTLALLALR